MSLSPQNRARALAATREAAAAFVEDMAHIRELLGRDSLLPRDLRHLSGILRRLLIDNGGDIRAIAPPRIGKVVFTAPENSLFYTRPVKQSNRMFYGETSSLFLSGSPEIFGFSFRAIATGNMENLKSKSFDSNLTVDLSLDGFLNQRVVSFQNEWANRRDVIKYVANILSGVHTGVAKEPAEKLLNRARNFIKLTREGESLKMQFNFSPVAFSENFAELKWDRRSFDFVLIELYAAAHYLCISPAIIRLEIDVTAEFS